MADSLTEEKQLGIACGTPLVMILLAIGAGSLGGPAPKSTSASLADAHDSFQASVVDEGLAEDLDKASAETMGVASELAMTSSKPELIPSPETASDAPLEQLATTEEPVLDEPPQEEPGAARVTSYVEPVSEETVADLEMTPADAPPGVEATVDPSEASSLTPIEPQSLTEIPSADALGDVLTESTGVEPTTIEPLLEGDDRVPELESEEVAIEEISDATVTGYGDEAVEVEEAVEAIDLASQGPAESLVATEPADLESGEIASVDVDVPVLEEPDSVEFTDEKTSVDADIDEVVADVEEVEDVEVTSAPAELDLEDEESVTSPNPEDADASVDARDEEIAEEPAIATDADTLVELPEDPTMTELAEDAEPVPASETKLRPFLGVGIRNPESNVITTLYANSTAARLGIKLGDQLMRVNGKPVTSMDTLKAALSDLSVADDTSVEVLRDGQLRKLGPQPLGSRQTK